MSRMRCVWRLITRSVVSLRIMTVFALGLGTAVPGELPSDTENADARAAAIVAQMTLDEQIQMVNGQFGFPLNVPIAHTSKPEGAVGSAGFIRGVPRLKIPALQETDGGQGIANLGNLMRPGDQSTALPSGLALASSFDLDLVRKVSTVPGAEARAKGLNVVLGGIAHLTREPRGGRNFEAAGEDPLLSGRMVAQMVIGTQSQGVVSTLKHFVMNVQETGRSVQNAVISEAALRESDLLAFQIAAQDGHPGSIMTAYNKVNGVWNSEHDFLLNKVIKGEWGYPGWIMTDWGGTHSTVEAALGGLDQESGREFDEHVYFGEPLKQAVQQGRVPVQRLADMNRRILRSLIAVGVFDNPPKPGGEIDWEAHAALTQRAAEEGIVLLKNEGELLPLSTKIERIAIIGGHADKGVAMGGGGAQVMPHGGVAFRDRLGADPKSEAGEFLFASSSPLAALRAELPHATITFDDGVDAARASAVAKASDVAFVFATKPSEEGLDNPDLSLSVGQDRLIDTVAAAQSNTVVVLETGTVVLTPWIDRIKALVMAWFPGQRGGEALAAILSGRIAPSGRLPISFPQGLDQLPRPTLPGWYSGVGLDLAFGDRPAPFDINYFEGSDVGYRWYERQQKRPQFAFGHGLTYTHFKLDKLSLSTPSVGRLLARFTVTNAGTRPGVAVPQLYVAPPGRTHRLVGWMRLRLQPGERRSVGIEADPRLLASYTDSGWTIAKGRYDIYAGQEAGSQEQRGVLSLSKSTRN